MKLGCILALILIFAGSSKAVRCFCDKRNCQDDLVCNGDFCLVGFKSDVRLDQMCGTGTVPYDYEKNVDGWEEVSTCQQDFCNTFAFLRESKNQFVDKRTKSISYNLEEEADPTTLLPEFPTPPDFQDEMAAANLTQCYCTEGECDKGVCWGQYCLVGIKNDCHSTLYRTCASQNLANLTGCQFDLDGSQQVCACNGDLCNTYSYLAERVNTENQQTTVSPSEKSTTDPKRVQCYSCMSQSYLSKWPEMMTSFYPPVNFTNACKNGNLSDPRGNSVATVECAGPCVTLIEETGYIRGCSEKLLLFGIPEPLHSEIGAMGHQEACRVIDQQLMKFDNPKLGGKIFLCSCYSDQCNTHV